MPKKKKRRSAKRIARPKKVAPGPKKSNKFTFFALAIGVGLVLTGGFFLYQKKEPQRLSSELTQPKKENVRLREKRNTLSPQRFRGRVYVAYQIAREIPEVLDRLYCYCRCRENNGHKNLLSCYVDTHAST
jgi:hypothetical protein